nr:zinc finger, CCHC-type [Tanacetum cinerariifolium]
MASNPEQVRLNVLAKLQEALDEEAILEEQILALMHRFADRFTDRKVEINNLMVLYDHPLIEYGADLVQKARLETLRSELETLRIKPNKNISNFRGKLSSIMAKFKGLGETLEDKVLVRKLVNSAPNKFLPIVATIEQYHDLDEMSFEEVVGRLTAYEERIKSQDTLEANDQDKLLMAS